MLSAARSQRRRRRRGPAVAVAVLVCGGAALAGAAGGAAEGRAAAGAGAEEAIVASVADGDTLTLRDGRKVRLLQVDTPELGSGECYARAAAALLRTLARPGSVIRLEADPGLDRTDRYGRLLRYVHRGGLNVNLELVRQGAAAPYFYRRERGVHSARLAAAAVAAKAARRGLWGACPGTQLDPERAVDTGPGTGSGATATAPAAAVAAAPAGSARGGGRCDPSYPDVCIAPAPPDLDCAHVPFRDFRVLPPDPHRFDGRDGDGRGCEGAR